MYHDMSPITVSEWFHSLKVYPSLDQYTWGYHGGPDITLKPECELHFAVSFRVLACCAWVDLWDSPPYSEVQSRLISWGPDLLSLIFTS